MLKSTLVVLLSLCLTLAGCTSTRTIAIADRAPEAVPVLKAGDRVVVTLNTGETRRMKVESVDAQTLTGLTLDGAGKGSSSQLALSDIRTIEVRKTSAGKSIGLALGVIVGVAVLVVGGLLVAQCGTSLNDCGD
jgi:hypothetical protein